MNLQGVKAQCTTVLTTRRWLQIFPPHHWSLRVADAHAVWTDQHERQDPGGRDWPLRGVLPCRPAPSTDRNGPRPDNSITSSTVKLLEQEEGAPVLRQYRFRSRDCTREGHVCFKSFGCFHQQLPRANRTWFKQSAGAKGISVFKAPTVPSQRADRARPDQAVPALTLSQPTRSCQKEIQVMTSPVNRLTVQDKQFSLEIF